MLPKVMDPLHKLDFFYCSELHKNWNALQPLEKFLSLRSMNSHHPYQYCLDFIKEKETELDHLGFKNTILTLYSIDNEKDYSQYLFKAIKDELTSQKNKEISAEIYGIIGYAFLNEENFSLAKVFYQQACLYLGPNDEGNYWKFLNNTLICDICLNQYENHMVVHSVNDFFKLPAEFKRHLSKILFFQLCHLGFFDSAIKVIEESFFDALKLEAKEAQDELYYYYYYIHFLLQIDDPLSSNNRRLKLKNREIEIKLEIDSSFKLLKKKLLLWDRQYDFAEKYILTNILFHKLNRKGKYATCVKLFSFFEDNIRPKWKLIIPPTSLYYPVCIACKNLKKKKDFEYYHQRFKETSKNWEQRKLAKEIREIDKEISRKEVHIIFDQKAVIVGKNRVDFKMKKKSFSLMNIIYENFKLNEYKTPFNEINNQLYEGKGHKKTKHKIASIVFNINKYLGLNGFLSIIDEKVCISSNIHFHRSGKSRVKLLSRENDILKLIAIHKITGIKSSEIIKTLNVPRRTILKDLGKLINENKIYRTGRGRATLYHPLKE